MPNPTQREQDTFERMIKLYCRGRHRVPAGLCPDCEALWQYACRRLQACRFGAAKPTCRQCPVHCYRPDMRQRVKDVMRYAGPRLLFTHPLDAIRHFLREKRPRR